MFGRVARRKDGNTASTVATPLQNSISWRGSATSTKAMREASEMPRSQHGKLDVRAGIWRFDPTRLVTLVGMDLPEEEQRRIREQIREDEDERAL